MPPNSFAVYLRDIENVWRKSFDDYAMKVVLFKTFASSVVQPHFPHFSI